MHGVVSSKTENRRSLSRRLAASLPWHLRKSITDVRANWRGRKPAFDGVHSSFDEFAAGMIVAEDDQIRAAEAALKESRAAKPRLGLLHHRGGRSALSQSVALLGANGSKVRVLDFGGAAGADFNNLLISNGADANVDYHVVDFPGVCRAGERLWAGEDRISFSPELPVDGELFDVVYSWGAVQYAPDPIALVTSFARYRPSVILVIGTAFSDRGFVRKQVNQSRPFPHWVLSLPEAERALDAAGYRLACRQAVGEPRNVDNFPPDYQVPDYASLLFVRR